MVRGRRLLVLLYAASGTAALVYEVAWTRLLTLQLGHTVASASTVLAAFMGGLACGAWLATRLRLRGLRAYATLEIVIAVAALLLPLGLAATAPILAWAYADGTAPATFTLVRIAISLALLGLPTAAMGATFPVAADCAASFRDRTRVDAAVLYTANTAGAACGAIAAGFWLIPALGLRGTIWVGVMLNVSAAAGAWWLSSHAATGPLDVPTTAPAPSHAPARKNKNRPSRAPHASTAEPVHSPAPRLACVVVAISGFAALVYEVTWTRLVALGTRSDDLRVCDDGGSVHQRTGDWLRDWDAHRAARPPAGDLDDRDADRVGGISRQHRLVCRDSDAAVGCRAGGGSGGDVRSASSSPRRSASSSCCCR